MPAHIPPGREHLWRRQAESDAEVKRLTALYDAAEKRAERLSQQTTAYDPRLRALDAETERINLELDRAEAVAERVHQERTAGLSGWIDHDPSAPICRNCKGTGGPPGHDAHGACTTCRGWGREYRPPIPVWSDKDQQWINPATGHTVDLLAQPTTTGGTVAASIEEVRAGIGQANDKAQESLGAIQQAHADLEQAQGMLQQATEGSGQADVNDANGLLQQAISSLDEIQQNVQAAIQAAEGVAARL